ncbi:mechanosensitive ion channel family protein [Tichowtungia aerotolerans]|uniref:Mechanosensitive ion channel n=1 Tax=Tichowtungia aerotolerans TaxID=2697043 RepID=A0A6P1MFW5_9BACT|nr:mechanosensitive ion channel domain-containing protein [Tichowtungia aerotolerans]QHI69965.1 mechanosensitive ion channel [Tichowtungia aerotolerans]
MLMTYAKFWNLSEGMMEQIVFSLLALIFLLLLRLIASKLINSRVQDDRRRYHIRRIATYIHTTLIFLIIGSIWFQGIASLGTFLGLASAGLAVALHDTIANIAGFFFIEARKPFRVGDRIELDHVKGDVIDIRLFEFSLVEVGNWVDADQSTGRIVHVPNSMVMRSPLSNYNIGFEYIWNEIPVMVTFESNWKKAKALLSEIGRKHAEALSVGAQEQIRRAARKYLIIAGTLTPTVYTTVKDSGVMLTVRYIVNPRQRRGTEQQMWEEILDAFAAEPDIDLAYNTTRFYTLPSEDEASKNQPIPDSI